MALGFFKKNTAKNADTPNGALQSMIDSCCSGNVAEILDIFQIGGRYREKIAGLPAPLRGIVGTYGKKLFKDSKFHVGQAEMLPDGRAAVPVDGVTVDGKALANIAAQVIGKNGDRIGLFQGLSLKNVPEIKRMVDFILSKMTMAPTKGVVHLEQADGSWQICDRDELTAVLANANVSELVPEMKEKIQKYRQNA